MTAIRLSFVFLLFVAFATAQASAGLIITEVMYYPEDQDFEYIELYNNGTTSVQLSNYQLTHSGTGADFGSLSGTLLGGDTIVLFNDDLGDFAYFYWSPPETIQSLAVQNWQSIEHNLNAPSLTLQEIIPVDPFNPDSFTMSKFDNSSGAGWPDPEQGRSIYLKSLNDLGPGNWGLSDPLLGVLESEDSGIGTPGYQVFPTSSPLVPEPTSLAIYTSILLSLGTRRRRRNSGV